jgi:hypothetical protein
VLLVASYHMAEHCSQDGTMSMDILISVCHILKSVLSYFQIEALECPRIYIWDLQVKGLDA